MSADDLDGILAFLRAAERLKTVTRSGWTSTGQPESVAEHTWRLCLMAMLLYGRAPGVDLARLLRMCLIHDLGEAIRGDVPAPAQAAPGAKSADERADLLELTAPLPTALREEIVGLWDEYEGAQSAEARLAKGLDKLETILQHTQGMNPADFDYDFNLGYGRRFTEGDPVLAALRDRLDEATRRRAADARAGPMTAHIALLRAVNLGSHNKVGMADLRTCLERQGFVGVRTLLQSGNVVLGGGRLRGAALERRLEETARAALGLDTPFIVRTRDEWDALVAANPFPREAADDPGHLLLFCLKEAPPPDAESRVRAVVKGRERVRVDGRQAYVVYPDGVGQSKLTVTVLERWLGSRGTGRNWNTVLKLQALAAAG